MITTDKKVFNNKCKVHLRQYSKEKIKIYYTNIKEIDYNNFDIKQWNEYKLDEQLPNDTTCIATVTEVLDRTHSINYQLEILLENNVEHKEYFYTTLCVTNEEKINIDFVQVIRKKYKWCDQMIKKILADEVYIGTLVQSKTECVSYKNKKKIKKAKKDWIRVENTHEPIIEKIKWLEVQERLKHRMRADKTGNYSPYVGKLFCEECGRIFSRAGDCKHTYFGCKDRFEKYKTCDNIKYINKNDLDNFIIDKINNIIDRFYEKQKLEEKKEKDITDDLYKDVIDSYNKELLDINKELQVKKTYFQRLYEDRANGLLDTDEYIMLKTKYKDDSELLEERIVKIKEKLEMISLKKEKIRDKSSIISKYKNINSLEVDIVNDFINKIYIGKVDKETNKRNIKIEWNFEI